MSDAVQTLAPALEALLPPTLTPEQRARYAAVAAIMQATVDRVPHATDEFLEPAPVFDLQIRATAAVLPRQPA